MHNSQDFGLHDSQLLKNFSYINGSWHSSETKISVTNPATGEEITQVSNAGIDETELAVKSAKMAFSAWSAKSAKMLISRTMMLQVEQQALWPIL